LVIEEAKVYSNPLSEGEMKKEAEAEEMEKKKKEEDVRPQILLLALMRLTLVN
jgi:hypothetical protein